jgi:hypothetical protein
MATPRLQRLKGDSKLQRHAQAGRGVIEHETRAV